MACDKFEAEILKALDDSLTEEEQHALVEHLSSCDACRAFQEAQTALDRTLAAALGHPSVSPRFSREILRRVDLQERGAQTPRLSDLLDLAGASGVAAALGLSLYLLVPWPEQNDPAFTLVLVWISAAACAAAGIWALASGRGRTAQL